MSDSEQKGLNSTPGQAAIRLRIVAGILHAAARYVPVPLVDDLVREQVARWLVRSTLPAGLPRESTRVLYTASFGCLGRAFRALVMIPIKLILFPIRKMLAVVLGVRWISRDVVEMILLGRVIDHALAEGLLTDSPELGSNAQDLRTAFDMAMKGTDTQFLVALLGSTTAPVRDLLAPALKALRALRSSNEDTPALAPETTIALDPAVSRIEAALSMPEVRRFVAEFDGRVIENLAVLRRRRSR